MAHGNYENPLQEMVKAIVREVDPERIIMFGSRARGDSSLNSDTDLLIIKSEPFGLHRSKWKEMSQLWSLVARFRKPVDLLLYSKDEVEKWRNSKNHVISKALSEGKILYERH